MSAPGRIIATVGPVSVAVIGGTVAATSVATVLVGAGAAVALGLAGYGVYRYLTSGASPARLPHSPQGDNLPAPIISGNLVPAEPNKRP